MDERAKKNKKSKTLKSFRGLITGKSRREKKKAKEESKRRLEEVRASTTEPPPIVTEEETVYGAEVETVKPVENETTTDEPVVSPKSEKETTEPQAPPGEPIHIILLLMDPQTRRFELLQLEFDTNKACVADILQQIPISATEESLRTQTFDCVCDTDGKEYDQDKPISEYVDGTAIVIAVPKTASNGAESVAKMAKPILLDPKVEEMLTSAGVTVSKEGTNTTKPTEEVTPEASTIEKSTGMLSSIVSKSKEYLSNSVTSETSVATTAEEASGRRRMYSINSIRNLSARSHSVHLTKSHFLTMAIAGGVMAYVTRILVMFNGQITTPLGVGSTLKPGAWRSRCGLSAAFPLSSCKPAYVEMTTDSVLQVVEDDEVTFSLIGSPCDELDDSCEDGAVFGGEGLITIGGVAAKVGKKTDIPLVPWPFDENVVTTKGRRAWRN